MTLLPRAAWPRMCASSVLRRVCLLAIFVSQLISLGHVANAQAPPPSLGSLAAGTGHSLAATPAGQVWSWGDNNLGQLGTGDRIAR